MIDEFERDDLAHEARRGARLRRCECGFDLPGQCPGAGVCPHAAGDDDPDNPDE